jgi:predicted O-methyltransferase YrrM
LAYRSLAIARGMASIAAQGSKIMMGARPVLIGYPGEPRPRWEHGPGGHPALAAVMDGQRSAYAELIRSFGSVKESLARVPESEPPRSPEACWANDFFTGTDAALLYAMLATRRPKRYFEIGSGYSTKLARRAIRDHGLEATVLSIDPSPRAEIDALCDTIVRRCLEDVDIALFDELEAGDVLFFDGSHYSFMGSDVVVFWLEVLPRLRPGVLVQIHDIFLPYDYPREWADRFYTEQYLLAVALTAPKPFLEVVFPAHYAMRDPELSRLLVDQVGPRATGQAASFWLRTR